MLIFYTRVINNASFGDKKNMNLPGAIVDLPTLTPKDIDDLQNFGVALGVDFIAASFVRKGEDIDFIRSVLGEKGKNIKIIAKIENQEGLENYDKILEKTPGVKIIYSSVKDFLEAFAGNKKKFDKPVLVCIDAEDIWRIGFITQENCEHLGLKDHVTVYVPHSYAISGISFILPLSKTRKLPKNINAAEAMKYAISGGVTTVDELTSNKEADLNHHAN